MVLSFTKDSKYLTLTDSSKTDLAANSEINSVTADDDHYGTDISIDSCAADDDEYKLRCTLRVA